MHQQRPCANADTVQLVQLLLVVLLLLLLVLLLLLLLLRLHLRLSLCACVCACVSPNLAWPGPARPAVPACLPCVRERLVPGSCSERLQQRACVLRACVRGACGRAGAQEG